MEIQRKPTRKLEVAKMNEILRVEPLFAASVHGIFARSGPGVHVLVCLAPYNTSL